jgi:hypothetical protein
MKNLLFIILLSFLNSSSQNDGKIIFLFEKEKDTIVSNQNEEIYKIDGKHTFKFIRGKHEKVEVNYNAVKENTVTYNEFIRQNKGKKYPELFNNYSFYILIKQTDSTACLIQVDKVWLVEDKIID